jgi:hypothetical protein
LPDAALTITDISVVGTVKLSVLFKESYVPRPASFNGSGVVAWVEFKGLAEGVSPLSFVEMWTFLYNSAPGVITRDPCVPGEIVVMPKTGDYHTYHVNVPTDAFPNDYVPMVMPVNGKSVKIAPFITCTNFEDDVWKPNYHPCKLAQTLVVDDDWSDGDANYTYIFEDWTDYDWNDITVRLYAVSNSLSMKAETFLESRDAAWKNPFGVEITPLGMTVEIRWNSTDNPENHTIQLNSGETANIEVFAESNPYDTASITIVYAKTPVGGHAAPIDKSYVLVPKTGLTPEMGLVSISIFLAATAVTIILIRYRNKKLRWGR